MKTKRIAVLNKSANMAAAMVALLTPRLPGASFRIVSKQSDVQPGEAIASIGIPGYLNPSAPVEVITVNTRYTQDEAARQAQRDKIASPTSTPEELVAELGSSESVLVIPMRILEADKTAILQAQVAIFEAESDEERADANKAFTQVLKDTHPAFKMTQKAAPVAEAEPGPEAVALHEADLAEEPPVEN